MFEELWSEIVDAPGEIFDIPELRELDEENKFNYNEYILGNIDYWNNAWLQHSCWELRPDDSGRNGLQNSGTVCIWYIGT